MNKWHIQIKQKTEVLSQDVFQNMSAHFLCMGNIQSYLYAPCNYQQIYSVKWPGDESCISKVTDMATCHADIFYTYNKHRW
jgi:hypothetical protein